jgi:hypothetical protein
MKRTAQNGSTGTQSRYGVISQIICKLILAQTVQAQLHEQQF